MNGLCDPFDRVGPCDVQEAQALEIEPQLIPGTRLWEQCVEESLSGGEIELALQTEHAGPGAGLDLQAPIHGEDRRGAISTRQSASVPTGGSSVGIVRR